MHKKVTILGATGSIGSLALELIADSHEHQVEALTAQSNWAKLYELALLYKPKYVGINDLKGGEKLKAALKGYDVEVCVGKDSVKNAVERKVDAVLAANSGSDHIADIIQASKNSKVVAIANKESIVCGGKFFTSQISKNGAKLLPVDSEHSALFRMNLDQDKSFVKKVILTASGGPFLRYSRDMLNRVTPAQAVTHPTWEMGKKISVDSATLVNKGLEVIEAINIFDLPPKSVEIVIHEKSVVHALLVKEDNSLIASMSQPNMKGPIWYALNWPELRKNPFVPDLNLLDLQYISFSKADHGLFPSLGILDQVLEVGGTSPIVFNMANECAVQAFLNGRIAFTQITDLVDDCLQSADIKQSPQSVEEISQCIEVSKAQAEQKLISLFAVKN